MLWSSRCVQNPQALLRAFPPRPKKEPSTPPTENSSLLPLGPRVKMYNAFWVLKECSESAAVAPVNLQGLARGKARIAEER
jgi:hypothetical protein